MKRLLKRQFNKVNSVICGCATGIFFDDYWIGKDRVLSALDKVCNENGMGWHIEESHYIHDDDNKPIAKKWIFKVYDDEREGYGIIIASGAGSVSDPLSRYDIVSYVS